ncbi:MAG: hypothetical protein HY874_04830 [Chloroflexi bacterium]|nr:hypothetical protein [Chloroflexota bacterium]
MWVFYGLLPSLIVLFVIAGGVVLLVRRGSDGWSIQFPGVLLAYVATAMLVGVFLVAAGASLLLKAGLAQAGERDFSYDVQPYPYYEPYPVYAPDQTVPSKPSTPDEPGRTVDPSDNAIRDDIATGISLTFAGTVLLAVHAFGAVVLRRRRAQGAQLITRAYNLVGLAVATLGFMGTGAQALNDVVRRYVVGGDTVESWQIRHPGDPLSTAIVLFPLVLWFGWRVWQEMGGGAATEPAADEGNAAQPAGGLS